MDGSPGDLQTKYHKIAGEYSKVKLLVFNDCVELVLIDVDKVLAGQPICLSIIDGKIRKWTFLYDNSLDAWKVNTNNLKSNFQPLPEKTLWVL